LLLLQIGKAMDRTVHDRADPVFGGMTSPIAIGAFFQLNYGGTIKRLVYNGADGVRTRDLLTASQAFSQTELRPQRISQ
jgi:hypothetical protein